MDYIRRHNYDKYWRCPGWSGGGWLGARNSRCPSGSLEVNYDRPRWLEALRFHRCSSCDVLVLPYVTRWLDPTWWKFELDHWIQNRRDAKAEKDWE